MPKLTVGFCRKVGEPNYGSRGANESVEADLDGLPTNPETMRAQIAGLFRLARQAVAEELAKPGSDHTPPPATSPPTRAVLPISQNGNPGRPATPNQVKALYGLARRAGADLKQVLADRFRAGRPEDLSLKQASALIDEWKQAADAHPAA